MVLSPQQRKEIASEAAKARWQKDKELELDMSELSILKKELFGDRSSAISDIKFYPGTDSRKSIDEIAGYALAGLDAIKTGNCRDIDLTS